MSQKMKCTTWPEPPIHPNKEPPKIPETFTVFGTCYKTVNGRPYLDMPTKPLDVDKLKSSIDKSFSTFMKLIETMDSVYLNDIRDIHIQMNEDLNMAKEYDGFNSMIEAQNDCVEEKVQLYQKIKDFIENKKP